MAASSQFLEEMTLHEVGKDFPRLDYLVPSEILK